jgi:ABC-type branched-subunit amino acid transport system ATPase component
MKRKPFVAVIGGARSGKTTVIRSLTGYATGNPNTGGVVTDLASNRSIFVVDKSPQESGLTAVQFERALRRCVNDHSIIGFVMATQATRPRSRLSLEEIFEAVSRHTELSPMAFLLDPGYSTGTNRRSRNEVQSRLDRFGGRLVPLDGRRFAHLNACRIRELTGLP